MAGTTTRMQKHPKQKQRKRDEMKLRLPRENEALTSYSQTTQLTSFLYFELCLQ